MEEAAVCGAMGPFSVEVLTQLCRDCWAGLGARVHQLLTEARLVSLRHGVSETFDPKGCVNELGSEPVSQLSVKPGSATCPESVN